ncbi:hypothetical protein [Methylobacterium aquaticum]|uniref:hypothetical protein n=1 Tax=Methylobacterium aquaticum TaxID=270351 RepID=UPI00142F32E6|nr:hypothetical protein [Methylobacterium aquaticum]
MSEFLKRLVTVEKSVLNPLAVRLADEHLHWNRDGPRRLPFLSGRLRDRVAVPSVF